MTSAVVFAYHNVGVRCLSVLLKHGVEVPLVITHQDNPNETIWFDSVAALAQQHGIAVITPDDPNTPEVIAQVHAAQPDFIFSFYYRNMLGVPLLSIPKRGAYNMHGSLLPKYRGRVPVNWAIIHGETETGATLHAMNVKPDNGAIVAQEAVPISINDTAEEVFTKVTGAAERALDKVLPALMAGSARHTPQDLTQGGYFKGRKPEDGRIDFTWGGQRIHNFVRALTRPYPGAFADVVIVNSAASGATSGGSTSSAKRIIIWATRLEPLRDKGLKASASGKPLTPTLSEEGTNVILRCPDGVRVIILELEADSIAVTAANFESVFGRRSIGLA